jgi:hypothetical protein
MTTKVVKNLSDKSHKIYKAGPWFVHVNRISRQCSVTSGDVWWTIPRSEAVQLILRKIG